MSDYSGHKLAVANIRERLAVSKQTTHGVHMEMFNLKNLKEVGVRSSIELNYQIGLHLWNG
jgi:hypothetical protein